MAALMPQGKQQYFTAGGIPLVGGKVYTYAAGTTTPLATYTTSAGTPGTENTNPVILDSRGEASIFFSAANYKIVVKDSLDSTIWTQDNLPGDQAATILANLAASTGSSLVGHIASGAGAVATTVQAQLRKAVYVTDFGAKGNGTTDDDATIINLAIASGAKHIIVPWSATRWLLLSPINMTTAAGLFTTCGVTLEFQNSLDINAPSSGSNPILAKHTGHVLDMSGARDCTIIRMNVEGDATTTPKTMIFSARNSAGSDCGRHRFHNIRSSGSFTTAPVYLYGTEECWFYSPFLINEKAAKSTVYITGFNTASLPSSFLTIATGTQSTSMLKFEGGQYHSQGNGGATNEVVFVLEACSDISINDAFLYCPGGLALLSVLTDNSTIDNVFISGCRAEIGADLPLYGVYFNSSAARSHSNWAVEQSYFNCDSYVVYLEDNQTLGKLSYKNVTASSGYAVGFKNLEDSDVTHNSSIVTGRAAGTNRRNTFTGYSANRTLSGTNTFNLFENTDTGVYETSVGYKFPATQVSSSDANTLDDYEEGTFTPVFTCGVPGDLAFSYGERDCTYVKIGKQVTVNMLIGLTGFSHTTASGAVFFTGMPFVAGNNSFNAISYFGGLTAAGYTTFGVQVIGTLSSIYLTKCASAAAAANVTIADLPTGSDKTIYMTFTYFV